MTAYPRLKKGMMVKTIMLMSMMLAMMIQNIRIRLPRFMVC